MSRSHHCLQIERLLLFLVLVLAFSFFSVLALSFGLLFALVFSTHPGQDGSSTVFGVSLSSRFLCQQFSFLWPFLAAMVADNLVLMQGASSCKTLQLCSNAHLEPRFLMLIFAFPPLIQPQSSNLGNLGLTAPNPPARETAPLDPRFFLDPARTLFQP